MAVQLQKPKDLRTQKPVRVIFTGGFLGAGKTTALGALARRLLQQGLTVGLVTNDQAANLVDTAIVKELGVPVAEVAGGCFCCRFSDLVDATEQVLANNPDVLLGEPVGSCTDLAATVVNPLKLFYGDIFRLAPFSVLVDPQRVRELVLKEIPTRFPEEVAYIFRKQLEEADIIVLNKVDTLSPDEADRMVSALKELQPNKPVLKVSALRGDGVDEWLQMLMSDAPAGSHILRDLDYDTYAKGEAVLGWLNATVRLVGTPQFNARQFAEQLMDELRTAVNARNAEVAHLKFLLTSGTGSLRAHLTKADAAPTFIGELNEVEEATLVLNARVALSPEALGGITIQAILSTAQAVGAEAEVLNVQSFSPPYPRPPYRLSEPIGS
ncbi:Hydrogenase isoenzymes nickel incorporation protein HypB [bacterium HR17]|uniref:Hydrogenase isoenzymes nickel incorporation protein HypB n=1 Tax=Candidatus Fervidibacter japonicus TaxID=2035412 RepID=A0A2H5XCH6_9BACT|nr:Hydrogenase isoenzymes nickel incorporation protein HypB [bacterium HR17]